MPNKHRLIFGKTHYKVFYGVIIFFCLLFFIKCGILCRGWKYYGREKIALICVDGLTWNLMSPLLKEGQLPNLSKLIKNGVSGELFSLPAYSPPAWASIATGKKVEKHGVHDYFDSGKTKVRNIWSIISSFGIKTGVMGWKGAKVEKIYVMYQEITPWEKINKLRMGTEYYPAIIKEEVKKTVNIIKVPDFESSESYEFWDIYEQNFINISMHIIDKYRPFFTVVGFSGADIYQHRYWSALEPQYFDITVKEIEEKGNLITGYYKKMDKFLDYFIRNNYTIIFVSDHGHCRNDYRAGPRIIKNRKINLLSKHVNLLVNRLLEKLGFLVFIPKLQGGAQIDFSKSQAYFYNNVKTGKQGIRINRQVIKEDKIRDLSEKMFLIFKGAHFETQEEVFIVVKDNISERSADDPDVILNLSPIFKKENISFEEERANPDNLIFNYLLDKAGEQLKKLVLDGMEFNLGEFIGFSHDGVHEHEGVIVMAGKNIRKGVFIRNADILDITPTILYLLGLPVAKDMDGKVLFNALESEFIQMHALKYIDTLENKERIRKEDNTGIEINIDRLRSLGYAQ